MKDGKSMRSYGSILPGLRQGLAPRLFEEVSGMSLDNLIVRPKRRMVEK